jgi:hypothetical protein
MAKMVGYACSIRLQWLNKAVQLLSEDLDEEAYRNALNEYLAFEIDSPTRLRKTREILMRIWFYEDEIITPVRKEALELINKNSEYSVPVHLCMIYTAYPVFADICKYMGKLFDFQDEITNPMIRQKLYDEWGERGSLESTTRRVTLTLKELGLLEAVKKTRYSVRPMVVTSESVVNFMLATAMRVDGNSYYSYTDLKDFSVLFPFKYQVSKEQLMADKRYTMTNFDGKLSIALNDV